MTIIINVMKGVKNYITLYIMANIDQIYMVVSVDDISFLTSIIMPVLTGNTTRRYIRVADDDKGEELDCRSSSDFSTASCSVIASMAVQLVNGHNWHHRQDKHLFYLCQTLNDKEQKS